MVEFKNTAAESKNGFDFFNPSVSILSKQLNPFIITGGLSASGELNFGISRDISD